MEPSPTHRLFRGALCALGLIALSACVPTGQPQVAQARTTLAGGALTIVAPKGWCIDPKTLQNGANGGFVLFGNCAAISGNPEDAHAPVAALLSVSVGPPAIEDEKGKLSAARLKRIEEFFRSDLGKAALARSGEAADVTVLHSELGDNMLMMRVEDRSQNPGQALSRTYLRGITDLGGRITALSVMPLRDGELSNAEQARLLRQFADTIRAAN